MWDNMGSKSKETRRQQKRRSSRTPSILLIELCKDQEIEAGSWVEFSTNRFWGKIKFPPSSIKVKLELRSVNDLKPRRVKLTVDHRPVINQITALPNKKNKFSAEIPWPLSRGDKIMLKIDGSRFFKWKTSLTLTVKKGRAADEPKVGRRKNRGSSDKARFCLNCGSLLLVKARFCHRCGTRISSEATIRGK